MGNNNPEAVVAGHLCLDIVPDLSRQSGGLDSLIIPGKLVDAGPAVLATGGAVSNTGLSLDRIGIATSLMGKIGKDSFGHIILDLVRSRNPALADGMIESDDDASSYTLVMNVPGSDRFLFHCPAANDTFDATDIDVAKAARARLFHFGYPPLMRAIYSDAGESLAELYRQLKEKNVTTALDMARPDPNSEAGRVDWPRFLDQVLPHVDIFLPSIDEIVYMVDRDLFNRIEAGGAAIESSIDGEILARVSSQLLDRGVAMAALKLGAHGFYLRTTGDADRLRAMGHCAPDNIDDWTGRELLTPCFHVDVVSAAGAGDCAIAGFLAAIIRGSSATDSVETAAAAGAFNCEAADANSGIRPWDEIRARLDAGWEQDPVTLKLDGWDRSATTWRGPNDGA